MNKPIRGGSYTIEDGKLVLKKAPTAERPCECRKEHNHIDDNVEYDGADLQAVLESTLPEVAPNTPIPDTDSE